MEHNDYSALINEAEDFLRLKEIAFMVLDSMQKPVGQVCGPISTGGAGSIEENLKVFDRTITKLNNQGNNVFNQMPFEEPMQRMKTKLNLPGVEANQKLLDVFYEPILESGFVTVLYFIHGWESSHGARWEHEKAQELGIRIVYLDKDFLED